MTTEVKDRQLSFEEQLREQPEVMVEGTGKDYWDDTGQVFFTGGHGYGLTPELQTICLGIEFEIQAYLKGGIMPKGIGSVSIAVLSDIRELKESEQSDKQPKLTRPSAFRSRAARDVKRRTANTRQASQRKRLSLR